MTTSNKHNRYFGGPSKHEIDCPVCGNIVRVAISGLDTYIATHIHVEGGSPETCPGSRTFVRIR